MNRLTTPERSALALDRPCPSLPCCPRRPVSCHRRPAPRGRATERWNGRVGRAWWWVSRGAASGDPRNAHRIRAGWPAAPLLDRHTCWAPGLRRRRGLAEEGCHQLRPLVWRRRLGLGVVRALGCLRRHQPHVSRQSTTAPCLSRFLGKNWRRFLGKNWITNICKLIL